MCSTRTAFRTCGWTRKPEHGLQGQAVTLVETAQMRLGIEGDALPRPMRFAARHSTSHQIVPKPRTTCLGCREHPAHAGRCRLQPRRHQARVGQRHPTLPTRQVQALRVQPVGVDVEAALLDHEHLGAQAQQRVEALHAQGVEVLAVPVHARVSPSSAAPSRPGTRCSRSSCPRPSRTPSRHTALDGHGYSSLSRSGRYC